MGHMVTKLECAEYEGSLGQDEDNLRPPTIDEQIKQHKLCFNPWALTESLVLTIIMSFLFVRIPYLFKFIVGFMIVIFYITIVFVKYTFVYQHSPSTNYGLDPKYSHMFIIVLTFIIFHFVDRQTEYIAKVDYNWKRQLQDKKEDAEFTNETIKILVHNILPAHVAEIYISKKMRDELYTEKYENVAIMFASIKNYENVGLKVLNKIICDFDEILISHSGPLKIEKIKVAGWTYMAACGLDPGRGDSTTSIGGLRVSTLFSGRRSFHSGVPGRSVRLSEEVSKQQEQQNQEEKRVRERKQSSRHSHNVVYVMTEFALELMKALRNFNEEYFQENNQDFGKLRIGISHGEIMAGVVGSSKPLYDVWGNAVNMASRMDSTGIPGRIQVTEETAKVLKSFGIQCEYRGLTNVKGRGQIPTHFVGIDDNLNFIRMTQQHKYSRSAEIAPLQRNNETDAINSKL